MKSLQMFKGWFWSHEFFRRLRPRLMTMMLALVLPVCLICVIISVISIVQSNELTYQIGNNGLSSFLKTAALQFEADSWDPLTDFPAGISQKFSHFYAYVEAHNGKVYVSLNGSQAFLLSNDGSYTESPEEFEALRETPYKYEWQGEELPFRVLVTFPYHFALAHVPFVLLQNLLAMHARLV